MRAFRFGLTLLLVTQLGACSEVSRFDVDRAAVPELTLDQLVPEHTSCVLAGHDALLWAHDARRRARARWERVWFAPEEAPRAVQELSQAVACYRASGERQARAEAEASLVQFRRELKRRYQRARLDLTLAMRAGDANRVIDQTETLGALISLAVAQGGQAKAALTRIERTAQALRFEQDQHEEPSP